MTRLFAWAARRPHGTLSLLFAGCVIVFLVAIPLPRADNLLIGSDGILYYCYVRSLVIDGDLDFTDEYARFSQSPGFGTVTARTPTGRPPNRLAIGLGLVWVPFFLLGHAVDWLLGQPLDGYTTIEQAAVCVGSMVYGFVGILLSYRLTREHADAACALIAVVLVWFASNLIYYLIAEPSMSHMASLGAVAALLAWWRFGPRHNWMRYWLGLGALGGLAALIRPQDGLFLLLPALDGGRQAIGIRHARAGHWPRPVAGGIAMLLAAAAVYAIQLWTWRIIYGAMVDSSYQYGGAHHFAWWHPHVREVLFSLRHGLFTWHPISFVALAGLAALATRHAAYATALMLAFLLQVYVVAAWDTWWQGDAFGGRMFISCVPIFTIGVAQVVQRLRRVHWSLVAVPAAALIVWNAAFFVQYRFGFMPMGEGITMRQLAWDKLRLPLALWRRWR